MQFAQRRDVRLGVFGDAWNGATESLHPQHLYHIVVSRPELVRYLGLPIGFRFYVDGTGTETELIFDAKIASER